MADCTNYLFFFFKDWIKYEETDDSDEKYISKYFENVLASVQAITSSKDDISTSESNGPRSHSPVASEKDEENVSFCFMSVMY